MSGHALNSYILLQKHGIFDLIFPHVKNSADYFDDFYKKAFAQTDDRVKIGKKLNVGFLYAYFAVASNFHQIKYWPKNKLQEVLPNNCFIYQKTTNHHFNTEKIHKFY